MSYFITEIQFVLQIFNVHKYLSHAYILSISLKLNLSLNILIKYALVKKSNCIDCSHLYTKKKYFTTSGKLKNKSQIFVSYQMLIWRHRIVYFFR